MFGVQMILLTIFAQAAQTGTGAVEFIQYGVLGLVVLGFLVGYIWPKPAVDRILKDKEAAEHQRDAMIEAWNHEVIPILQALPEKVVPAIAELTLEVRALRSELEIQKNRKEL